MHRTLLIATLTLMTLGLSGPAWAQSRTTAEARLDELRALIRQDEARLSQALEDERASMEKKERMDRQIALRHELVAAYRHQLSRLSLERDSLRRPLAAMDEELETLKAQYRCRARHAYKYGRLHDLALILSAPSINQMLIRTRYLGRFARQRRGKLEAIEHTSATLEARRAQLRTSAERTRELLRASQAEQRNLEQLRQERERVIRALRGQRVDLEEAIQRKRTAAGAFEAQIRTTIARETSRQRTHVARDPAAAYARLSGSFTQNRGQLPWPADGAVQEPFGDLVNPVHNTVTSNPGLLVATPPSAEVRSVFDGEVTDVDVMPGYGTFVTISHGEYKSVYSNFSMLYVERGDRVRTGQTIGRAGTDSEPKGPGVFFALFKGGEATDPMPWLQAR